MSVVVLPLDYLILCLQTFDMSHNELILRLNILGLQLRHQNLKLTTFFKKFLHDVNNPILNDLCKF